MPSTSSCGTTLGGVAELRPSELARATPLAQSVTAKPRQSLGRALVMDECSEGWGLGVLPGGRGGRAGCVAGCAGGVGEKPEVVLLCGCRFGGW